MVQKRMTEDAGEVRRLQLTRRTSVRHIFAAVQHTHCTRIHKRNRKREREREREREKGKEGAVLETSAKHKRKATSGRGRSRGKGGAEKVERGRKRDSDTGTKGHPSPLIGSGVFLARVQCPGHKHTAPSRRRVTAPVHCWTKPLSEVLDPGGNALKIRYLLSCRQGPLFGCQILEPASRSICRPFGRNKI